MKYRVTHTTHYKYSQQVSLCHSEARLQARDLSTQHRLSHSLHIEPVPNDYHEREDFFGNHVTYFAIQQPHTELKVTATSEVDIFRADNEPHSAESNNWETIAQLLHDVGTDIQALKLYCLDSGMATANAELRNYAAVSFKAGLTPAEVAADLSERIYHDFSYDPSFTTIATPLTSVLQHKRGVCQDFAHLAIACFRTFGLPARYVSGYIETTPPPGEAKLAGSDASHAWFSIYQPGIGWLDFDPTNNCQTSEQHITLAWGRDYNDVTPLKGLAVGGGDHRVVVSVDVIRLPDE